MSNFPSIRRVLLLAIGLLTACAAADPGADPSVGASAGPASGDPLARQVGDGANAGGTYSGNIAAYLDARFATSQSDPAAAARFFEAALAADPGNHDLLQSAFMASLLGGRPEAVDLARRLPAMIEAQYLLGGAEARAGQWIAAERRFTALPRQGLTQLLAPLLAAWTQQGGGHPESAMATLRPLADGQKLRGVYALHAALIADQSGNATEAERYYEVARREFGPGNLRLAQILASWQARQGHAAEAAQTLSALSDGQDDLSLAMPALIAADREPVVATPIDGLAEAYLEIAAALRQQDQGDLALVMLRLALDLQPRLTPARMLIADIQESAHHADRALDVLVPVSRDDPLYGAVRMQRVRLEERLGHTDKALELLTDLARDYPDNPLADTQMGDILRGKNRYLEAIVAYDRAVERLKGPRRSSWTLFYARGITHERAHQWPLAEADLKRALELAPDQPFILNYLGYTWADQGVHLAEARRMIERASEQRPNDGAIIDSLGWVMLRQGHTGEATQLLERAVQLQPEDSTINSHLGDAYWAVGRRLEAIFQWRRALTLNPDPDDKAKLEAKLRDIADQPLSDVSPRSAH